MSESSKSFETRLGQVLIRKKVCSLLQVNEALSEQRRQRRKKVRVPLGQILIKSGHLEETKLRQALAEVGALKLFCESCELETELRTYRSDRDGRCPDCGGPRILRDPAEVRKTPVMHAAAMPEASVMAPTSSGQQSRSPSSTSQRDSFLGKVLGGCQIESKIAHGGMGVVYRAVQLNLGRVVAVKVLGEDLARDTNFVRRFLQEARAAAQLNHGGIVHINDVGEQQGVFYFVMEFVDGQNLKEVLKTRKQLDIVETVEIMIQICQALRHAHSRGIIHRDIKPENIMITKDGGVKLADLGLAKRVSEKSAGITHAGSILGTPFYMPPEQAKDFSKVDQRSDVYSLGVTIYRVLTGKVPFYGRSPIEVMIKALDGKKTPMRELRGDIPEDVERVVDRMMSRLPEERHQSIEEVLDELMRIGVALKSAQMM